MQKIFYHTLLPKSEQKIEIGLDKKQSLQHIAIRQL